MFAEHPAVDLNMNAVLMGGDAYSVKGDWWEDRRLFDEGLEMTGKQRPNVLIVPTARTVSQEKSDTVVNNLSDFYEHRGATVSALHPYLYTKTDQTDPIWGNKIVDTTKVPGTSELEDKTEAADLIFVLGGDSNRMLNQVWRPLGIDTLLMTAMHRGTVVSGTSAGTVAWFSGGHSAGTSLNVNRKPEQSKQFHYIQALGAITKTVVCPHYEASPNNRSREQSFKSMLYRRRVEGELGLGITARAALQISAGGIARMIRGSGKADAFIEAMYRRSGKRVAHKITAADGSFPFSDFYSK